MPQPPADLTLTVETHSEDATVALGRRIGARLHPGDWVSLVGPMGAGKTALARGLAQGAGASGHMASPSFVLIREYGGPVRVFHVDLYRLEHRDEIDALGLEDLLEAGGIVIMEWADRAPWIAPAGHLAIICDLGAAPSDRVITMTIPETLRGRFETAARG